MKTLDIPALIDAGYSLKEDQGWPVYGGGELDRSKYMTSSECYNCTRRIKFNKLRPSSGFPNWGYAERGNIIEAWAAKCLARGLPSGYTLAYAGEQQRSFIAGQQSGTPDGVIYTPEGDLIILEIKSVDPRTNYKNLPKKGHIYQTVQNMDVVAHNFPDRTVLHGLLVYIDASNLQKRRQLVVEYDYKLADALEDKAETIMRAESPESLPAEGMFMDKQCDQCEDSDKCSDLVGKVETERKSMEEALEVAERAINGVFK